MLNLIWRWQKRGANAIFSEARSAGFNGSVCADKLKKKKKKLPWRRHGNLYINVFQDGGFFFFFFNSEGAKVFSWELKKFHLAALPNLLRESLARKLFFKASSACAAEFDAKRFEWVIFVRFCVFLLRSLERLPNPMDFLFPQKFGEKSPWVKKS